MESALRAGAGAPGLRLIETLRADSTPARLALHRARMARGAVACDADALQQAASAAAVVFDKTGTLTQGHPRLLACHVPPSGRGSADEALRIAAQLQRGSEHPLAKAVIHAADELAGEPQACVALVDLQASAGQGVQGHEKANGGDVLWRLGSTAWMSALVASQPAGPAQAWLNAKADRKIAAGAAATLPPQRVELLLQHVEHALVLFLRLLFQLLLGVVQALLHKRCGRIKLFLFMPWEICLVIGLKEA